MSFFGDVLGSIGADGSPGRPKPPPVKLPQRPPSANTIISSSRTEVNRLPTKPAPEGTASLENGKRKAEEDLRKPQNKILKSSANPGLTSSIKPTQTQVVAPPPTSASTASKAKTPTTPAPSTPTQATATKPPAKGSYADIMARARLAQEKSAQSQVGMIKHQAASKEKVSKMAQKRREDEVAQSQKSKLGKRAADSGRVEKRRSASPTKKRGEPKLVKQPRPPLSAPASSTPASSNTALSYRGTMGLPARKPPPTARDSRDRKPKKYDEYLGTDEEDDDLEDDDGGYDSNASSDMEAGAFDIDEEESQALKKAKEDDAKELALENKLKAEKEERRKKLQALADKRR